MSNVSLKKFVDINIYPHMTIENTATRDTVIIFTKDVAEHETHIFTNIAEVPYESTTNTYKYLDMYFKNGGIKAKVIEGKDYTDLTIDDIKALDNNYICIASVVSGENLEANYTALKTLAQQLKNDTSVYGANEKLLLASTHSIDNSIVKNFIVKYSSQVGAEMTIAAYLSQIDINNIDSVKDYAFTEEYIIPENITDSEYDNTQNAHLNVDIELANSIRNCGGDCKDGDEVTNTFIRIMLQQTLTHQLVNLLAQKISSSNGISKMYAVIAQELEKYRRAGYLTTDKVWRDKSWIVEYDNERYTIINKGDALINGYTIKILPSTVLSTEDLQAHKAPPIYIVIADQYGIRKITVKGQVF